MLKFNRRNKKLIIPVGLNPNYNIDVSALVNTSDADITPNDVVKDKIAYGPDGKVIGTLDINSALDESYNQGFIEGESIGYSDGVDVGRNQIIDEQSDANITPQDVLVNKIGYGANNQKVVGELNLDNEKQESYNSGYDNGVTVGETSGIIIGRQEIIAEQSDANITADKVFSGYIGYGANNERIVGNYEFVEGFDFSIIGYDASTSDDANLQISDDIAYAKQLGDEFNNIQNDYTRSIWFNNKYQLTFFPNNADLSAYTSGNYSYFFMHNYALRYIPDLNIKPTNCDNMFYYCYSLKRAPYFDLSETTKCDAMFQYCYNLKYLPNYDYSNVESVVRFLGYTGLQNINLNLPSVHNASYIAYYSPSLETANITFNPNKNVSVYSMFYECSNLKSVTLTNLHTQEDARYMFFRCQLLESINGIINMRNVKQIDGFQYLNNLRHIDGFKDLGEVITNTITLSFSQSKLLTRQSCLNIFNNIYDMTGREDYTASPPIIDLSAETMNLLSAEDIAIATEKGWIVQ